MTKRITDRAIAIYDFIQSNMYCGHPLVIEIEDGSIIIDHHGEREDITDWTFTDIMEGYIIPLLAEERYAEKMREED